MTREESGTDALLPEDIQIIDFSCPNVIKYAERKIAEPSIVPVNPVTLSDGESLQLSHLKWIIEYFRLHIDKILMHQVNPADKYDSGISDDDIDLIIKLTVGKNRLFGIDDMSKNEKIDFRDNILRIVLQNATGFQRVLSLLIISIINYESKTQFWHIGVQFLKTEKEVSHQKYDKIFLSKTDGFSPDFLLFHEMTHSFHHMVGLECLDEELISNISIINSRDLNLIDQFFPMLRPHVMNPVLAEFENAIDVSFGHDFSKIKKEEKERLAVLFLEPIIRNAMQSGFGNFIFPDYNSHQSLRLSTDMITSKRIAMCLYLSEILNTTDLYPYYNVANGLITVKSNKRSIESKIMRHPLFNELGVTVSYSDGFDILSRKAPSALTGGRYTLAEDALWNESEEKLTMQGNSLITLKGKSFYIQDRQHEQIYLIRKYNDTSKSSQIASHFRFHQTQSATPFKISPEKKTYSSNKLSADVYANFALLLACCPSLKEISYPPFTEKNIFFPSTKKKYESPTDSNSAPHHHERNVVRVDPFTYEIWKKILKDATKEEIDELVAEGELDVNITNENGVTPLHLATKNCSAEIVEKLIDYGAEVFVSDKDGQTPMDCAIYNYLHYKEVIELLLKRGLAANNELLFKIIKGDSSTIASNRDRDTSQNKLARIEFLLGKGSNINAKDEGRNLLHLAFEDKAFFQKGDVFIDGLLKLGINLEGTDDWNRQTPLLTAIEKGAPADKIELLLNAGAKVDACDILKRSALHYLVKEWTFDSQRSPDEYFKLTDLLLSKGLNINVVDKDGNTPLHVIASYRAENSEAINYLVQKGADLKAVNKDGLTPLEVAQTKKSKNAEYLKSFAPS